jgi:hypothetical protein
MMQVSSGIPLLPFQPCSTYKPFNPSTISTTFYLTQAPTINFTLPGVMLPLYLQEYFVTLHPF